MMTRTSRTAFRRAAISVATAATVFSGASLLNTSPTWGDDAAKRRGSSITSPCDKYGSSDKSVRCEIRRLDQRTKDANARGAAADARGAAADARGAAADARGAAADARGAAANARGAAADARGAAADKEMDCTQSIIAIINSGPDGKSRVKTALGGKSMRDVNSCTLLSTLSKS